MAKISVINPSTHETVEIETNVQTWGELRPLLNNRGIVTSNMDGMIRQTKVTLSDDGALLPQTDWTLYLFPSKQKAGN